MYITCTNPNTIMYRIFDPEEDWPLQGHSHREVCSSGRPQKPRCLSFYCFSACNRSPSQRTVLTESRGVGRLSHGRSWPQTYPLFSVRAQLCSTPVKKNSIIVLLSHIIINNSCTRLNNYNKIIVQKQDLPQLPMYSSQNITSKGHSKTIILLQTDHLSHSAFNRENL